MNGHFLVTLFLVTKTAYAAYFTTQCPQYCTCDFTASILTLTCTQAGAANLTLPTAPSVPNLASTSSIIAKFDYLLSWPANLCQFQSSLRILDLSSNSISSPLTASTFNCLLSLEFLNVSRNALNSIDANTFILMSSLSVIDMSHNSITVLPASLFTGNKLQNLKYLYLNNNLLAAIDVWFFYLNSIINIDLSYNQITQFQNKINWSPTTVTSNQLPNATLIDLRYNKLTRFDDSILASYYICKAQDLSYFFYLMNVVRIDQNPFNCTCLSYNMLMFYQTLLAGSAITTSSNLFKATCLTPSQYFGSSIFSFTNPQTCVSPSFTPLVYSCQTTTTTTPTAALGIETVLNPNNPELLLGNQPYQPVTSNLGDGQIAGIVVGFMGVVILIFILFYCLCPIELLACLFGIFPGFYRWCPCKSGVVSHKYYDVFVSYNKSSENWIREKLLPFMRTKRPNDKYFLQYDPLNVNQEKFGSFTRGKMENSAVILIVLSDKYLMKEWQVVEFRNHLRDLLTKVPRDAKDQTRLICIQMNDMSDEEVDDYVRHKLQIPRFISLENDEFYFWQKLNYFLHSNKEKDPVIVPVNITEPVITMTSDESPRSEASVDYNQRGSYLLDEYSTSLEQIIYEKLPSLSTKNETLEDIKYDHNSKKFTYITKQQQQQQEQFEKETEIERDAADEVVESIRRKHRKNRKNRRSSHDAHQANEEDETNAMKSVTFKKDSRSKKVNDENTNYF